LANANTLIDHPLYLKVGTRPAAPAPAVSAERKAVAAHGSLVRIKCATYLIRYQAADFLSAATFDAAGPVSVILCGW